MTRKNKYGMPPPTSRREFEHNVNIVIEDVHRALESGDEALIANKAWATLPHLRKVTYLPNRRIDLGTVNEMLRNQANTMNWVQSMDFPPPSEKTED